jgi:hypothetical protein
VNNCLDKPSSDMPDNEAKVARGTGPDRWAMAFHTSSHPEGKPKRFLKALASMP